ncbi:MAG TPA: substrate-binding domain-containing protein, partial [Holophaga sp.]|nr:substrate-binding domain-containing protein [Holophaga sp.]
KEVKIEQLDAAWTTSRLQGWPKDIRVWGDLGLTAANWAERPIRLVGQPDGSGVRDFFKHAIEEDGTAKPNIERGTDVMSMVDTIITDQSTMGYGSVSQVYTSTKSVPVIPVGTKTAVEPTQANVANGTYPLTMFTYMYVNKAPGAPLEPNANKFMMFVLSKEGQKQVQLDGHVPLPEDLLRMGLRRLER